MAESSGVALLKAVDIWKRFPGVVALSAVDFELEEGEIHGLVGGNGAGKTTFLKILNGILRKDRGEIFLRGERVEIRTPKEARNHGITLVRQVPSLFPNLRVIDNVLITQEKTKSFMKIVNYLDERSMADYVTQIFEELEISLPLQARAARLTSSQCKFVEIARALALKPSVICFDEPTSAMTQSEAAHFFKIAKELKKQGKSIIYVSHRIPEIFEICDRVTVFRDGKKVRTMKIREVSKADVVEAMTGRKIVKVAKIDHEVSTESVLEVKDLVTEPKRIGEVPLNNINFQVRRGEIVAVAGVVGAGKTELAKALMGIIPWKSGELIIDGSKLRSSSPIKVIRQGVVYLPEDFMREGLFPNWALCENISILSLDDMLKLFLVDRRKEKIEVGHQIKALNIRPPDLSFPALNLSGGNKKKVILARGLLRKPKLLILDELTMGIDVASKTELRVRIQELAKTGMGILLLSSDFEDVLIADRVIILREGRIVAELKGSEINIEKIAKYSTGVEQ